MARVVITEYSNRKEILKFNEFVATTVTVDDSGISANSEGKKIVQAGTIVGGKTKPVLLNPDEPVANKNSSEDGAGAEGVLLWDVDVTEGPKEASMVIFGFIDLNKIEDEPDAAVELPMIQFLK